MENEKESEKLRKKKDGREITCDELGGGNKGNKVVGTVIKDVNGASEMTTDRQQRSDTTTSLCHERLTGLFTRSY